LETNELKTIGIIFLLGMVCEILGVNYGLIFGDYIYLDNLGFKILGVPILIGFNWIILTLITGSLSSLLSSNIYYSVLCGAIFMILLDLLIEPVAPLLGFWVFDNEQVPVQNYVGWFVIGIVTQYLFQRYFKDKEITFSLHLLAANTIFFLFLNLQSLG
jgi:putative membrane protein